MTSLLALYARFRQLIHEAGRFGVVGLAGLVVTDGGANLLTYRAGLNSVAATAIAAVAATAVTFAGSRYWTFRHRERSGAGRETAMFFALNAVGIGITEACVGLTYPLGPARNGLASNVALNGGIALATMFRYWSYKKWVWPAAPAAPVTPATSATRAPRPGRLIPGRRWLPAGEMTRFAVVAVAGLLITDAGAGLLHSGLADGPRSSDVMATRRSSCRYLQRPPLLDLPAPAAPWHSPRRRQLPGPERRWPGRAGRLHRPGQLRPGAAYRHGLQHRPGHRHRPGHGAALLVLPDLGLARAALHARRAPPADGHGLSRQPLRPGGSPARASKCATRSAGHSRRTPDRPAVLAREGGLRFSLGFPECQQASDFRDAGLRARRLNAAMTGSYAMC
jgi:putative flippase GtrA